DSCHPVPLPRGAPLGSSGKGRGRGWRAGCSHLTWQAMRKLLLLAIPVILGFGCVFNPQPDPPGVTKSSGNDYASGGSGTTSSTGVGTGAGTGTSSTASGAGGGGG